MQKFFSVITLLLLAAFPLLSTELLLNNSFEVWSSGPQSSPDNWMNDSGIVITQGTEQVLSGSYSCQIDVITGTQTNCDFWQEIPVTAGSPFTYTMKMYLADETIKGRMAIWWQGGSTYYGSYATTAGDWETITYTGEIPEDITTAWIGFRMYDNAGFTGSAFAWIDDISFDMAEGGNELSLISANWAGDYLVDVLFSDAVGITATNVQNYHVEDMNPSEASIDSENPSLVHLDYSVLDYGNRYTLEAENILSVSGNELEDGEADFNFGIFSCIAAREYGDIPVSVQGVVTANTYGNPFYMQDEMSGIAVYDYGAQEQVFEGDLIQLTATVTIYNGLYELINVSNLIVIESGVEVPTPIILTPSEFEDDYQGMLVQLDQVHFNDIGTFGSNQNYTVTNEQTEEAVIRIDAQTNIPQTNIPSGAGNIVGILSIYNDYQILPRYTADFVFASLGQPVISNVYHSPTFPAPQGSVQIHATVTDNEQIITAMATIISPESNQSQLLMTNMGNNEWVSTFNNLVEGEYSYYIEAWDNEQNYTIAPESGVFNFVVSNIAGSLDDIVINEISYNDEGDDELEFIELKNISAFPVDLSDCFFSNGIEFTFPSGATIAGSGFTVIALDAGAIEDFFAVTPDFQWSAGNLSNGGELLTLNSPTGEIIDEVEYSDNGIWSSLADGSGATLELINPEEDNSLGQFWAASDSLIAPNGTPDAENSAYNPDVISLFNARQAGIGETVRFRAQINSNTFGTNFYMQDATAGISVYDNNYPGGSFTIGSWYEIEAVRSAYHGLQQVGSISFMQLIDVLDLPEPQEMDFSELTDNHQSMLVKFRDVAFSDTGLFSGNTNYYLTKNGENLLTRIINSTDIPGTLIPVYPGHITGIIGYFDEFQIIPRSLEDLNFPTAPPVNYSAVVINEIMYNPIESGSDTTEFIELVNTSAETINLTGCTTSGVDFTFPSGSEIPAGAYWIICNNFSAFENFYGTAPTYQWSAGSLSNSGETLTLQSPEGEIFDEVTFDDNTPWPVTPDGAGNSLELISPELDNSLVENWAASDSLTAPYGTPGQPNSTTSGTTEPNPINDLTISLNINGHPVLQFSRPENATGDYRIYISDNLNTPTISIDFNSSETTVVYEVETINWNEAQTHLFFEVVSVY